MKKMIVTEFKRQKKKEKKMYTMYKNVVTIKNVGKTWQLNVVANLARLYYNTYIGSWVL